MTSVTSFFAGVIFAVGLGISGMTDPAKVVGFLDVTGRWDPTLLFVMAGAVGLHFLTFRLIRKRESPLFTKEWHIPERKDISLRLVIGSLMFGIGWGLAGYCPGPAIVSLATLDLRPVAFVLAMLAGMWLHTFVRKS